MRIRLLLLAVISLALSWGPRPLCAEEIVDTAEDGTVLLRYEVDEQGRKDGAYARFHPNGRPAVKATYAAGQRHGLERTWDASGVLRSAHTFKHGVLHGAHKTYDEQGHQQVQQAYAGGHLHGAYKSYHPNRRLKVVTRYRNGKLHGKYHERTPAGATRLLTTYHEGRLHGTYEVLAGKERITKQVWERGVPVDVDGVVPFPRTKRAIRAELARILKGAGAPPSAALEADRELALRQLKAYRFLAGVPYKDIRLDATCNAHAQAGSAVCAALGKITHEPPNPGWPAARFGPAAIGAKNSNLHRGQRGACTSVRGYMDDSDPTNIDRLGHRCWCLNPAMLKTGFGIVKRFTAMWATDDSRPKVPDYPFVSLPPPGHVPGPWLGARWAWSIGLNPTHFDAPLEDKVRAVVEPVGEDFLPSGDALQIDFANVQQKSVGFPYLVIFRPAGLSLAAASRYRVSVTGLTHKGKPKALRYFVAFFDVPYESPKLPKAARGR